LATVDVSVWKVLIKWREEQQDNTRGTRDALTP
jgi:hypothetical protein